MAAFHHAQERGDLAKMNYLAHQMAGSAGSYGFPEIGTIAAKIEVLANSHSSPQDIANSILAFDVVCQRAICSMYPLSKLVVKHSDSNRLGKPLKVTLRDLSH